MLGGQSGDRAEGRLCCLFNISEITPGHGQIILPFSGVRRKKEVIEAETKNRDRNRARKREVLTAFLMAGRRCVAWRIVHSLPSLAYI